MRDRPYVPAKSVCGHYNTVSMQKGATDRAVPVTHSETQELLSQGNRPASFSFCPHARANIPEKTYKCQDDREVGPVEQVTTVEAVNKPHDDCHNGERPRHGRDDRGDYRKVPDGLSAKGFCCIQSRWKGNSGQHASPSYRTAETYSGLHASSMLPVCSSVLVRSA